MKLALKFFLFISFSDFEVSPASTSDLFEVNIYLQNSHRLRRTRNAGSSLANCDFVSENKYDLYKVKIQIL